MQITLQDDAQMRNGLTPLAALILATTLFSGCAPKKEATPNPPAQQAVLDAGFAALDAQQYNEALAKADEFLKSSPHGPASPEALYLKGRALEGKNASGELAAGDVNKNLQEARAAYIEA